MNLDNLVIHNASQKDINQIVDIKIDGWKSAYRNIISNDILDNMSKEKELNSYNNKYSLDNIFVIEDNGEILGFCRVYNYDNSPYEDKEIDCEIREIYVRPDLKRMGIGRKLFNYVLEYFRNNGKHKLYLGVFKDNYNSRKFYEKMGGLLGDEGSLVIGGKSYLTVSYTYKL